MVPLPRYGPIPRPRSGRGPARAELVLPEPGSGPPQTAELRQFLLGLPLGETVVLVTHQVNITALTGWAPVSGEVFLLRVGRDGTISVVDEILIGP